MIWQIWVDKIHQLYVIDSTEGSTIVGNKNTSRVEGNKGVANLA